MLERWDNDRPGDNLAQRIWRYHHRRLYNLTRLFLHSQGGDTNRVIADIACGVGTGYDYLSQLGYYIGLDGDTAAVDLAISRRPHADFRWFKAACPPWIMPEEPSVIVSHETAEHLNDPDTFLHRCRKMLPADGLFCFSAPTCKTMDFDPYHKHDRTESEWRCALLEAGFQIEHDEAVAWSMPFREFVKSCPTTWRQKARVASYNVVHPSYGINRVRHWILGGTFHWSSQWFGCRVG